MLQPFIPANRVVPRPISFIPEGPGSSEYAASKFHPTAFPLGHIGQVLMPGKSTWVAGTEVAVTSKSRKKALDWKYLMEVPMRFQKTSSWHH